MSSFDTWIPRILTTDKDIYCTQANLKKSVLTKIVSYDEWQNQTQGVWDRIKLLVRAFEIRHQAVLDRELANDSLEYYVASKSLTLSVGWIVDWCSAFEELYKRLLPKLDDKATLHIVTRLMAEIWVQVNKPRQGLHRHFRVSKKDGRPQLAGQILWSMMQSHDQMARFKANNFVNDPSVTADLVSFLLLQ